MLKLSQNSYKQNKYHQPAFSKINNLPMGCCYSRKRVEKITTTTNHNKEKPI